MSICVGDALQTLEPFVLVTGCCRPYAQNIVCVMFGEFGDDRLEYSAAVEESLAPRVWSREFVCLQHAHLQHAGETQSLRSRIRSSGVARDLGLHPLGDAK